jgi:hypothetical protein
VGYLTALRKRGEREATLIHEYPTLDAKIKQLTHDRYYFKNAMGSQTH